MQNAIKKIVDSKPILNDFVVKGITWKQVRDVFKKIGFDRFTEVEFIANLFRDTILDTLIQCMAKERHQSVAEMKLQLQFNIAKVRDAVIGSERYYIDRAYIDVVRMSRTVGSMAMALLIKENFICLSDEQNSEFLSWELTEIGHSLRMQKALKRIGRIRAEVIVNEMVAKAVEFNIEDGPLYFVDRIWAYGSYARGEDTVGDIDIIVRIISRRIAGDDIEKWQQLERERAKIVGGSTIGHSVRTDLEAVKRLRISPYLSISDQYEFVDYLKDNNEFVMLVYDRTPTETSTH